MTASLLGLCFTSYATAVEPTAAEQQYERLKGAEKHNDKLLAERWHKLVRQRQWVDATGKHKTFARYVDHDPDLQWVKLLVLVKKGDEQAYKEGKIPLARLSKNDQALVKRIGIVRKQVETALADATPGGVPAGETPPGEGEPFGEVMARELGPEGVTPDGPDGSGRESSGPSPDPAVAGAPPAMEPWRTDFAAFAANFSTAGGQEGPPTLNWGELHGLKAVYEMEQMLAMLRTLPTEQQPPLLMQLQQSFACVAARTGLGEVTWKAGLDGTAGATATDTGLKHDLQLPAPLTLMLVPDPDYAGDASRFGSGQPVQFIGRFAEFGGSGEAPQLKLLVRLPGDQRASTPAR